MSALRKFSFTFHHRAAGRDVAVTVWATTPELAERLAWLKVGPRTFWRMVRAEEVAS